VPEENPIKSELEQDIGNHHHFIDSAFFSKGFRPFFLGAALWAILAIILWIGSWLEKPVFGITITTSWHIHEMLFGFTSAAISGFLLTAIPNWTGRLPVQGLSLLLLFGLWLIGRIAMTLIPTLGVELSAGIDALFLVTLSFILLREIISGKNWRNLKVVSIVVGLALANISFHLEQIGIIPDHDYAVRAAVSLLVLLVSLIGGRIIPSFTRNTLKRRGNQQLPAKFGAIDRLTLTMTIVVGISYTLAPFSWITGIFAISCSILQFCRLSRWCGLRVLFEPMLWILHLSYLWISIGFALLGLSIFLQGIPQSSAIHAFTTGAFASMILSIMTRASRGHTGRSLQADKWTSAIYISISLAAITRVLGSIFATTIYYQGATLLWLLAFGVFLVAYWPVLVGKDARFKS